MAKNNQQGLNEQELEELLDLLSENAETLPPSQLPFPQFEEDDWLMPPTEQPAPVVAQAPTVQPPTVQPPTVQPPAAQRPAAQSDAPTVQRPAVVAAAPEPAPVEPKPAPVVVAPAPEPERAPQRKPQRQPEVVWGVSPKTLIRIVVSILVFALMVLGMGAYMWNEGEERRERMHNADQKAALEQQKAFLEALERIGKQK